MKTAIVTDSTFYMNKAIIDKYHIIQVPLSINFENETFYEDQFDEEKKQLIFAKIEASKKLPKTSQPSPNDWLSCFKQLYEQGYERILVFCVSTNISGTFYGAKTASEMFCENHHINIEVYDSCSDGNGSSIVLYDILQQMELDHNITTKKINDIIAWHQQVLRVYLVVNDLNYLSYGGRIPKSIAHIGNALSIKPLIMIPCGKLLEHSKHRNQKRAMLEIANILDQYTKDLKVPIYFTAAFLFAHDESVNYGEMIKAHSHTQIIELPYASFGAVIGDHVGPKSIGYG